ncbi:MAG: GNAT family N-acetyltransferase [Hyphomicrobiaceae bacterium]
METGSGVTHLRRWAELPHDTELIAALDAIFYEASHTKSFESEGVREAFRHRWLGRYLDDFPELSQVLFVGGTIVPETLAGYVIGAHHDPALTDRYDDIGYFPLLADLTRRFPAHLHINLRHDLRGRGYGAVLIERFVEDVRDAGLPGVHVVTGAGLRNVGFYKRNGFEFSRTFPWKGNELVFLGRDVAT